MGMKSRVTLLIDTAKVKILKVRAIKASLSLSRYLVKTSDLVEENPELKEKLEKSGE